MMIMIPPIHMERALQMRRLMGWDSTSERTDSPVVVIPDTASKNESTMSIPDSRNGTADMMNMISQTSPMRSRPFTERNLLDSLKKSTWTVPRTRSGSTGSRNTLAGSSR